MAVSRNCACDSFRVKFVEKLSLKITLLDPRIAKVIEENEGIPLIIGCLSSACEETVLSAITTLYYLLPKLGDTSGKSISLKVADS